VVELIVVVIIIIIISVAAILQIAPALQGAQEDTAMRQVLDQLRQAREYSIANRRYVQVTFPTSVIGAATYYQVQMILRNDLTTGAAVVNPTLSTVTIEPGVPYSLTGMPDTPDGYGNSSPIYFGGVAGGPVGGMLFQSDGELVSGTSFLPINGTVFMGIAGQPSTARAVTVLGATGRVRGWRSSGSTTWVQF
jgi:type II secretory pathway pseudopilin PulG